MDVILLERVAKLGSMGETVSVKPGYARNYLLPKGMALRANDANRDYFESQRQQLEQKNSDRMAKAEELKEKLDGQTYVVVRSAGETGQLYGSVSARDVAAILAENGFTVARNTVELNNPIKIIGLHDVPIQLHPDVAASVTVNVARSEDEAKRQADGEDLTSRAAFEDAEDEATEGEEPDLEAVFDNPDDVELSDDGLATDDTPEETAHEQAAEGDTDDPETVQ